MYVPGTILKLKDPRSEGDPEDKDYKPFAYDRVRVIGPSPIMRSDISSEWVGAANQGVLIEPVHSFGANSDEPIGKLQMLYDVESEPELTIPVMQQVRVLQPGALGPSPEEVFAQEAKDHPSPPQENKWRSPLADAAREKAQELAAEDKKKKL